MQEERKSSAVKSNDHDAKPQHERETLLDPDLAEKLEMRTKSQVFENAVMAKEKSFNKKGVVG